MRVKLGVPEELDDKERAYALDAALEASTRSIVPLVRRGVVPTAAAAIKRHGVRWRPEPPGDEHFDLPQDVLARKWGDCDDLAPYHAASLRASGADPGARAFVKKSGPNRWHAVVRRTDGSVEDPSLAAGMGRGVNGHQVYGANAPIWKPMFPERMSVAMYPMVSGALVRVDVPDTEFPWSWSGMHFARETPSAVVGAMRCARLVCGDGIDPMDDLRLSAIEDLVLGADPSEVGEAIQDEWGDDVADDVMEDAIVVGSFFDKITSLAKGTPAGAIIDLARGRTPTAVAPMMPGHPGSMPGGGSQAMPLMQMKEMLASNPSLQPFAQMLLPLAGMAATPFLGPMGPMASGMLSQFLMPGAGQMAPQTPQLPQMMPGIPMQPGGQGSPMFMRF
jgi:hypothetical protein